MATETDKVNNGALGTLVAVGVFSTIAVALGVDALVRYETSQISAERASHASERYRSIAAEQTAKLSAPPSAEDRGRGLVTITDAMAKVAAELAKDPTSASPAPPASADPHANFFHVQQGKLDEVPDPPPGSAAPVKTALAAPPTPAPSPAGSVSPKASTVLAVPSAPPAAPPRAPAPTAPAPTDG